MHTFRVHSLSYARSSFPTDHSLRALAATHDIIKCFSKVRLYRAFRFFPLAGASPSESADRFPRDSRTHRERNPGEAIPVVLRIPYSWYRVLSAAQRFDFIQTLSTFLEFDRRSLRLLVKVRSNLMMMTVVHQRHRGAARDDNAASRRNLRR